GSQIVIPGSGRMTSTIPRMSARGVKYCPAPDLRSSAFRSSNPSLRGALDVDVERHPLLAVDQVDDQPAELRGILDPVLRLPEDDAEHARLLTEVAQDVDVVRLELVTVTLEQALPVEPLRNERLARERRFRQLVGHLQEEQVRQLLEVVAVREP